MRISYFDLLTNSTKFIEHLSFTKLCARYTCDWEKQQEGGKNKREKEEKNERRKETV